MRSSETVCENCEANFATNLGTVRLGEEKQRLEEFEETYMKMKTSTKAASSMAFITADKWELF